MSCWIASCSTRSAITAATMPRSAAIRATCPARIRIGAPFGLELMNDIIAMIPVDRRRGAKEDAGSVADAARAALPAPSRQSAPPRAAVAIRNLCRSSQPAMRPISCRRRSRWTAVPGVPNARWRASKEEFDTGTDGAVGALYDVAIGLPG